MNRLIYKSTAANHFFWPDAVELAQYCKINNEKLDLTGFLMIHKRSIMQVLEGPTQSVNFIYSNILQDTRHFDIHLIANDSIVERQFSKWKMKEINFKRFPANTIDFLQHKYHQTKNQYFEFSMDSVSAFSLLQDLYHLVSD